MVNHFQLNFDTHTLLTIHYQFLVNIPFYEVYLLYMANDRCTVWGHQHHMACDRLVHREMCN